jgi:hypothetical protein
MIKKIFALVKNNLNIVLFVTPILNLLSIWILLTIHWLTGKLGYLYATFFLILGVVILLGLITLNQKPNLSLQTVFNILITFALCLVIYLDLQIMFKAISNSGFIPCPFGGSCP